MSQYAEVDNLNVHIDNFRSLFHNELIRLTSIGIGTYIGDPDDLTDFEMYNAIKTSVLSGAVNHIDTAPNYRYMKSEKVVGKILNVLDRKYDIHRD
jgi:aryl-alcohol dehydrogenase-like predicted oxidoreductase